MQKYFSHIKLGYETLKENGSDSHFRKEIVVEMEKKESIDQNRTKTEQKMK